MGYIYKITNDINQKIYIGQTRCSLEDRWRGHRHDAFIEEKTAKLQRAIRKYGLEHFTLEMIEECSNDMLNEREEYWIEYYNSYYSGYNSSRGGSGQRQLRVAHVKDGQIVKIYDNYADAASDAGCMRQRISDVVNGRRNSVNGRVFRKLDGKGQIINPKPPAHQHARQILNGVAVIATNIATGEEIYFESATRAIQELDLYESAVNHCLNGRQKTAKGYKFRRAQKQNHVFVTAVDDWNQSYAFPTQKAAYTALGVHHMVTSEAMTGRKLTGAGYFWTDHPMSKEEWDTKVQLLHTHFRTKELSPCNEI
jgi:group I intron endonuclease